MKEKPKSYMERALNKFDIKKDDLSYKILNPYKKNPYEKSTQTGPLFAGVSIYCDLLTLPKQKNGYNYLCVCVDAKTKGVDFEAQKTKTGKETMKSIKTIMNRGYLFKPFTNNEQNDYIPRNFYCDAGSEFNNVDVKTMLEKIGVTMHISRPGRKSQTGLVESFNHIIVKILSIKASIVQFHSHNNMKSWTEYLDKLREVLNDKVVKQRLVREYFMPMRVKISDLLKIGQKVLVKNEKPTNVIGIQEKGPHRVGDVYYSIKYHIIQRVIIFSSENNSPRYVVSGIKNAGFLKSELIPITEDEIKNLNLQQF